MDKFIDSKNNGKKSRFRSVKNWQKIFFMVNLQVLFQNRFHKVNNYYFNNSSNQSNNMNYLVYKYPMSKPGTQRVYVWGLQEHGALGTIKTISFAEESVAYSGFPHRLSFGEYNTVTDIATGYGFTAFAVKTKDHRIVYGSGINSDSQLGKLFFCFSYVELFFLFNNQNLCFYRVPSKR